MSDVTPTSIDSSRSRTTLSSWISTPFRFSCLPHAVCLSSGMLKEPTRTRNPPVASSRPPGPPRGPNENPGSRRNPEVRAKPLSVRDFHFAGPGLESPDRYRPGGYHPVHVGDVYHERYRILNELGYGTYSTVWFARDLFATKRT